MRAHAATEKEGAPPPETTRPRPPPPVRVLLTNDDGPLSPFFIAWVEHVRSSLGWRVFVAPPAEGQSFVSKAVATGTNHSSSSSRGGSSKGSSSKSESESGSSKDGKGAGPKNGGGGSGAISLTRVDEDTVHVCGPPATAVNLALHHLSPDCDFVVSGPNVGHNVGRGSVLSSGTVGAALEGAVAGKKSIALSFPFRNGFGNWSDAELRLAVEASGRVVRDLWEGWGEGVDLYNVNVPLDFNRGAGKGEGEGGGEGGETSSSSAGFEFRVSATTVDPGAQYSSLYRRVAAASGEEGEEVSEEFEWGPSGLRVFDEANGVEAAAGGDVEAVRRGRISVTALRAALAHVEAKKSSS